MTVKEMGLPWRRGGPFHSFVIRCLRSVRLTIDRRLPLAFRRRTERIGKRRNSFQQLCLVDVSTFVLCCNGPANIGRSSLLHFGKLTHDLLCVIILLS